MFILSTRLKETRHCASFCVCPVNGYYVWYETVKRQVIHSRGWKKSRLEARDANVRSMSRHSYSPMDAFFLIACMLFHGFRNNDVGLHIHLVSTYLTWVSWLQLFIPKYTSKHILGIPKLTFRNDLPRPNFHILSILFDIIFVLSTVH